MSSKLAWEIECESQFSVKQSWPSVQEGSDAARKLGVGGGGHRGEGNLYVIEHSGLEWGCLP